MAESPFFSVLIPTKNRSHIVGMAIQSVLEQTFGDFEVIVADNDDSDTATREVVQRFDDPRLRYHRTGGLSIADNWELALTRSTGRYITILQDKQAFYPNALEAIRKVVSEKRAGVISWRVDGVNDVTSRRPVFYKNFGDCTVSGISSDKILRMFLDFEKGGYFKSFVILPRVVNSCVSREVVELAKSGGGGRFFDEVFPDFSAALKQLNTVDEVFAIGTALNVSGSVKLSTGFNMRRKRGEYQRFIAAGESEDDLYCSHVPVKNPQNAFNVTLNVYLRLRERLGGRLARYRLLPRDYILACFRDLMASRSLGVDVKEDVRELMEYVETQDRSVTKGLSRLFAGIRFRTLKEMVFKSLPPLLRNAYLRLRGRKMRLFTGLDNALDIARDERFSPDLSRL